MSEKTLSGLATELHLQIGTYLSNADLTYLSLTCKRLNQIHAIPYCPRSTVWTISAAGKETDFSIGARELKQWDTRNLLLPRLQEWILRVSTQNCSRDATDEQKQTQKQKESTSPDPMWKLCTCCTTFKAFTGKGWKNGPGYRYTFSSMFADWNGTDWKILRRHISKAHYCEACVKELAAMGPDLDDFALENDSDDQFERWTQMMMIELPG